MRVYDPFTNANALIFGAATGIGRAVADEFARRGTSVGIADINLIAAQEAAQQICNAGGKAFAFACDVASDASVASAAEAAEAAMGPIDVVMNNVGAILNGNPEDIPTAEWQRMMDLNCFGAVRAQNVFIPKMIARRKGHIVNTCSFAGLYPYATSRLPYVAAKGALIGISESLALYLLPHNIRVSAFCVGPVMTSIADSGKMKNWSEDCLLRGPGSDLEVKTPEMVAAILAEGMLAEKILIATDDRAFDHVRARGENPDAFIRAKLAEFEAGDAGRPFMPEELKAMLPQAYQRQK